MRLYLSLIFSLIFILSNAQQAYDYTYSLLEIENLNDKQNISFRNNLLVKNKNNRSLLLTTKNIAIEAVQEQNPFIALSINNNISSFDVNNTSFFYKIKANNIWEEWIKLNIDDHTQRFKQVYIAQNTTAIQFKIEANAQSNFELDKIYYRLFYPGFSKAEQNQAEGNISQLQHKSLNCNCAIPKIKYRNDWCPNNNCPKSTSPTPTNFTHLVVHHSAGSNSSPDWGATVRSIWNYHTTASPNGNGWADVGYNYLIDPNGVIYEGRGDSVQGAHFSCMNSGAMGVCLLGNFNNVEPTTAMLDSLIKLMAWKSCELGKDPRDTSYFANANQDLINLCGHRDGNKDIIANSCTTTECPGNNVYDILGTIRENIVNYAQNCTLNNSYSNIVVLSMNATPDPIYINEAVQLNLSFKNIGDAAINEQINITYKIDGNEVGINSFNTLNINETKSLSYTPYTFTAPGTYRYCAYIDGASNELITNNNSYCIDLNVTTQATTAIKDLSETQFKVYPNPAKNKLFIEGEQFNQIEIYNTLGQVLIKTNDSPINISDLKNGMYYIKIKKQESSYNSSFIKTN